MQESSSNRLYVKEIPAVAETTAYYGEPASNLLLEEQQQHQQLLSDLRTQEEIKTLKEQHSLADLKDKNQNITLRKKFAYLIFSLVFFWLIGVLVLVFFQGFHLKGFDLGQSTTVALLTTTSANTIALLFIVLKYLFNNSLPAMTSNN